MFGPFYVYSFHFMAALDPDALFAAHLGVATKLSHSLPIPCFSPEETEQEARQALWQAACKFDSTKGAFEAFATIVIRNHLRNTFNKAKRDSSRADTLDAPLVADDDAPGRLALLTPFALAISLNDLPSACCLSTSCCCAVSVLSRCAGPR
jgi:DNA-directed RNA polymerase specialized sigma24 family protein